MTTTRVAREQDRVGAEHPEPAPARSAILLPAVLGVLAAPVLLYLYVRHESMFDRLTREDGVVEYATAGGYLLASIVLAVVALRSNRRNLWLWGLAAMFFFVAGEEISWGQRLFGLESPGGLAERNVQGETNLHNIDGIHGSVRAASLVVLWTIFVAAPLLWFVRPARDLVRRFHVPVPPVAGVVLAVIGTAFMVGPRLAGDLVFSLDEAGELYFGVLAAWFAFEVLRRGLTPPTTSTEA